MKDKEIARVLGMVHGCTRNTLVENGKLGWHVYDYKILVTKGLRIINSLIKKIRAYHLEDGVCKDIIQRYESLNISEVEAKRILNDDKLWMDVYHGSLCYELIIEKEKLKG